MQERSLLSREHSPAFMKHRFPPRMIWALLVVAVAAGGFGLSRLPLGSWVQSLTMWFEGFGAAGFLAFGAAYVFAAVLIPVWPLSVTGGLVFGLWGFLVFRCRPRSAPQRLSDRRLRAVGWGGLNGRCWSWGGGYIASNCARNADDQASAQSG